MKIKQSTSFTSINKDEDITTEKPDKVPFKCKMGLHKFTVTVAPFVMKCEHCPKEEYMGP